MLQNENARLVTALPYLDEKVEESMRSKVNDMILLEMKQMDASKDYLEKLPLPKLNHLVSLNQIH